MRTRKISFGVVVMIFGMISCEEAPERFKRGNEYVLVVPEGTRDEIHVFTTNEAGKVLHSAYWQPGDNDRITVYAPEGFTGNVNFHYVTRFRISIIQHQSSLHTITDVAPGSEITWQPYVSFPWHLKYHKLTVQGIPTNQYSKMWQTGPAATPQSRDVTAAEQTFSTPILPGPLTYILQGNNDVTPRYFHFSEALPDQSTTVPFSEFLPAEKVNVTVSEKVDHAAFQVYASFTESQRQFVYTGEAENAEHFSLYYYPQSIFPDVETLVTLEHEGLYFNYTRYGGRVSELNLPDMKINSLSATDNRITANVSGAYDTLHIGGGSNWAIGDQEYLFSWNIMLAETSRSVSLPDLRNILSDHWPEFRQMPDVEFNNLILLRTTLLGNDREEWSASKYVDGVIVSNK